MTSGRAARRLLLGAVLLGALPARAQEAPPSPRADIAAADTAAADTAGAGLAGVVVNEYGEPISFAQVYRLDESLGTVADDSGRFLLSGMPAGRTDFVVRRIGYEPISFHIELLDARIVHVRVRLTQVVARLSETTVEAEARVAGLVRYGFYERKESGRGAFFTPEEIDRRNAFRTSDIVRDAPGIIVDTRALARTGEAAIYGRSGGKVCGIALFVDGIYTPGPPDQLVSPSNILAVEVYSRATTIPQRFQRPGACGALVIWTDFVRWIEARR